VKFVKVTATGGSRVHRSTECGEDPGDPLLSRRLVRALLTVADPHTVDEEEGWAACERMFPAWGKHTFHSMTCPSEASAFTQHDIQHLLVHTMVMPSFHLYGRHSHLYIYKYINTHK
jgi:hypothetical protein